MKRKIYLLTCKLMLLIMGISISQTLQAQAVVQVPSGCDVVSTGAGAGTALGPGGLVGNGGIVVMRDPYAGGNFTLILSQPGTSTKWQLYGDLIFTNHNVFTLTPGSFIENIKSFNKNPRTPEINPPSNGVLARSKGRVKIDYTQIPCNGVIEFDIYKNYSVGRPYLPPIVGPDCWKPGERLTYSVDPIASDNIQDMIGIDQYYWRVTSGNTSVPLFYTSGDRSSITFDVPNDVSCDWEITCWYGRANAWDAGITMLPNPLTHPVYVTKTGRVVPSTPTFSTPPPTCLPTGTTTFLASIQPQCASLIYSWSCPYNPGVTVTTSGTQNEHVTVSGLDDNPVFLSVSILDNLGACQVKTFNYYIDRTLAAPMALLTTPTDLCLTPGDQFTLTLPANAMNNPTTWILPTGWGSPQLNNAVGSSATFTVPMNIVGGSYPIGASATQCPGTPINANISVMSSGIQIVGSDCITYGSTAPLTYSVTAPGPGNFDFDWSLPPGWTASPPVNTSNTSTITVTPNGTSICSLAVEVCSGGTQCCMTATKDLDFNPVTPTIVPSAACYQAGVLAQAEFHIQTPLPGTYVWSVDPQFGTIVQTQSTTDACGNAIIDYSITVQYELTQITTLTSTGAIASFNALNLQNAVSVFHQTPCGNSASDDQSVSIASGYTLEVDEVAPGTQNAYSILTISPMPVFPATFQWLQNCNTPTQSSCTACGTLFVSNPMTNTGPGFYGVRIVSGGCTTVLCLSTDNIYRLAGGTQGTEEDTPEAEAHDILLSPNPNSGEFELHVPKVKEKGNMVVYNSLGAQLFQATLKSGTNTFSNTALPAGMYILHLTIDGKTTVKKMEVAN